MKRGGSWNNAAGNCRPAYRNNNTPTNRNNNNGFRVLCSAASRCDGHFATPAGFRFPLGDAALVQLPVYGTKTRGPSTLVAARERDEGHSRKRFCRHAPATPHVGVRNASGSGVVRNGTLVATGVDSRMPPATVIIIR